MDQLQQARINNTLNTEVRYEEGVMTRKEWLLMQFSKGCTVKQVQEPLIQYNRIKYNRMTGREQEEYEKKCNTMKTGYRLNVTERSSFDITKTEYDYFLSISTEGKCNTCKEPMSEMDHNYGTEDILTCIHCYHDAQI